MNIVNLLRKQAEQIAIIEIYGWGNTMSAAADLIEHLHKQMDELGDYILEEWPDEIGAGDPVHGEGAIDVAIRLLKRYKQTLA